MYRLQLSRVSVPIIFRTEARAPPGTDEIKTGDVLRERERNPKCDVAKESRRGRECCKECRS